MPSNINTGLALVYEGKIKYPYEVKICVGNGWEVFATTKTKRAAARIIVEKLKEMELIQVVQNGIIIFSSI